MAKKHKNLENIKIQWDGDLTHPQAGDANQSIPASVDLGFWGGYRPCWADENGNFSQERADKCVIADMYFEDFDVISNGDIDITDVNKFNTNGRSDIAIYIVNNISTINDTPKAPKTTYTWGDVVFIQEIADGIGTGSRRAREARLQQLDKDKKKRLIRLICRVKGEEVVYDEEKEVGDIQLKLDDVDMVISKVMGTMKVSTEWEEVDWDYGYDK